MSLLATAAMLADSGSAHACPAGYKRVTIQGNSVCRLDASASDKLKALQTPRPAKEKFHVRKPH
jgi:hypothetical protein